MKKEKYMKKEDYPNCPTCGERCSFDEDGWYCPKCRDKEFMKDIMESEKNCTSCIYYKEPLFCNYIMARLHNFDRCHCWIDKDGNEY